jgi:hypothetical protein
MTDVRSTISRVINTVVKTLLKKCISKLTTFAPFDVNTIASAMKEDQDLFKIFNNIIIITEDTKYTKQPIWQTEPLDPESIPIVNAIVRGITEKLLDDALLFLEESNKEIKVRDVLGALELQPGGLTIGGIRRVSGKQVLSISEGKAQLGILWVFRY